MAQFKDGDSRTINGVTYVRTNGSWLPKVGGQFAAPTLPFQAPQAQAALTGANLANTKNAATQQADIVTAKNNAVSSGYAAQSAKIKARGDQYDLNVKMGIPPGDVSKTGDAYLATLPPGVGDLTREMLAGKFKGNITNTRNPAVSQAALAAAHATEGQFDAVKYDERQSLIKSMVDPNSSLGALNTALAHAGHLYDQAGTVAGTDFFGHNPLSVGANAIYNLWHSSSPAVAAYENTVGKYGPEQARAYNIGTGGERQDIESQYSVNAPLDTKLALLKNDAQLYAGKIASLAHGYDMLGANSPLDYLSPDAKAALQKIDPDTYNKIFGIVPPGSNTLPPPGPLDRTNYGGDVTPATGSTTRPDPAASALIDSLVSSNVPYGGENGALAQFRKRFPTATPLSPSQYNQALLYHAQHPNETTGYGAATQTVPLSGLEKAINGAVNFAVPDSTPVIGGFSPGTAAVRAGNAYAAGIPAMLAGDQGRYFMATSDAAHPNSALVGDIAGTALGAAKFAKLASPFLTRLPGAAGRFFSAANAAPELQDAAALGRQTLASDIGFGNISGAAQNPDHPLAGAAVGGLAMAGGNLAGRYVLGPSIRTVADSGPGQATINFGIGAANRAKGMFGAPPIASFSAPSALNSGQMAVMGAASKAGLGDIRANLQDAANLGLPYSLADANPQLRALAGSAARKNADVMALANNTLNPRALGQAERAISGINQHLAPVTDVPTAQADILKAAQAKSAPLYDAAKSQPVPELPSYPALQEVLDRPAGQAAIRKGYEAALNNGEDVGTLTYATDANGNTVASGNPSWNVIHYARQALDANGETAVRRALDKQIATINPGFKAADAAYSTAIKGSDALQAGADATKIGMTPEATQASMGSFPNNLPQFQQGYASNLADLVERQRLSGNPYNAIYGSPLQQAKVGSVFPSGAPNFNRLYNLENDMAATRGEVLGGSQTAARTEADKAFDSIELGNALAKGAVSGGTSIPFDVAEVAARKGSNFFANRMSAARAGQIGPILLNQNPLTVSSALDDMIARNAAYQRYLQASRNAGGMFGAAGLLPFIPQGQ